MSKKPKFNYFLPLRHWLFIGWGMLSLCGCMVMSNQNKETAFFFVQLSDPQLGFYPDSLEKEIAAYKKAVRTVNRLKPDFVVITGDLVNDKRDEKQLTLFKNITAMIHSDIPVYYTPGNHDVGNDPAPEDIDFYSSIYGYDHFSFRHKGSVFIGINSNLIKAGTPFLEEKQYQWLEKTLKAAQGADRIVVFCHHPFFIERYDEKANYFTIDKENRLKYLTLFNKYGVNAVYAGHYHRNGRGRYKNMKMVTTSAVGEPLGDDPQGFRIVEVYKDSLSDHYYALDSVPETIHLQGSRLGSPANRP